MLFENDVQTILAPGVLFGANGQPGSMAIGNTLMLLMKPPTAQGGVHLSFPHLALPKWAIDFPHCAKRLPVAGAEALLKPVHARHPIFPEDDSHAVSPEVPPRLRRCKRGETRSYQRENLCIALACAAGAALRRPRLKH